MFPFLKLVTRLLGKWGQQPVKIVYEGGCKIQNIHTNPILPTDDEEFQWGKKIEEKKSIFSCFNSCFKSTSATVIE